MADFSGILPATKKGLISLLAVLQRLLKNEVWISYQYQWSPDATVLTPTQAQVVEISVQSMGVYGTRTTAIALLT